MGLFDSVLGGLEANDAQHAALYGEVGKLVTQAGGVSGLEQQFQQKGLGGVIAGWITEIAAKAGLSEDQVANGITKLLPMVVDHLTPNGTATATGPSEIEGALGALKSKLLG